MKHIPILPIVSMDKSESKELLADKDLSQICSTDEGKPESVIVDEIPMEESKSECVHKKKLIKVCKE